MGEMRAPPWRMKEKSFTVPEIALLAGTRVVLGAGVGFLLSDKLNRDQRKGAGWALFGVGVLSSIPLFVGFLKSRTDHRPFAVAS